MMAISSREVLLAILTLSASCYCTGCKWNASGPKDAGDEFDADVTDGYDGPVHLGFGPPDEYNARRISFLASPDCGRDADGDLVVYSDCRQIYLIDLETETEVRLEHEFLADRSSAYPSISGRRIAFSSVMFGENEQNQYTIAIWDIDRRDFLGRRTGDKARRLVRIYNDVVAWEDLRFYDQSNQNSEIYMFDLSSGIERRVTVADGFQVGPDIWGDHIVWRDERDPAQWDIWMYTISTGEEKNISAGLAYQGYPKIWGDRVVWQDLRNGTGDMGYRFWNTDIYLYDIATGETRPICTHSADQYFPEVSDGYVVWDDLRNSDMPNPGGGVPHGLDVYLYDLGTGIEKRVTFFSGNDSGPLFAGERIVWSSTRADGQFALYMIPIAEIP